MGIMTSLGRSFANLFLDLTVAVIDTGVKVVIRKAGKRVAAAELDYMEENLSLGSGGKQRLALAREQADAAIDSAGETGWSGTAGMARSQGEMHRKSLELEARLLRSYTVKRMIDNGQRLPRQDKAFALRTYGRKQARLAEELARDYRG